MIVILAWQERITLMQSIFPNAFSEAVSKHFELPATRRETLAWLTLLIMQQLWEEDKQGHEEQYCVHGKSERESWVNRLALKSAWLSQKKQ